MLGSVPEECPQEIADLIASCTADAAERPDAQECAHIIAQYVPNADARRSASRSLSGQSPRALLNTSGRAASGASAESGAANSAAGGSVHGGTPPAAAAAGAGQRQEHTDKKSSAKAAQEAQVTPGSPSIPEGGTGLREPATLQATKAAQEVDSTSR